MITELYDALISAGAPEDKARKAAEVIAGYDDRFNRIEQRLSRIDGSLRLMQWQIGAIGAVMVVVGTPAVWLLLRIGAKVGALG